MKKQLILALTFFFSIGIYAQSDDFDISNYVLPELDYKSLNSNISLSSSGNFQHHNTILDNTFTDNSFRLNINGNLNAFRYHNSEKKQKERRNSANFSPYLFLDKNSDDGQEEFSRILNLPFYFVSMGEYRKFYKPKRFVEYESNIFLNTQHRRERVENPNQSYTKVESSLSLSFSPGVLWGFGRVEDVTYAWHSQRILEDLNRFNLINRSIDDDQVLDLADYLAQRAWTRFFDSRLKYMEDLELLADKIAGYGIITERSPRFYSSLNDMFRYGTSTRRLSGQSLAFGLTTYFDPTVSIPERIFDDIEYRAGIKIKYERYKPISSDLQFDFQSSFITMASYRQRLQDGVDNESIFPIIYGDIQLTFGWFPNTRTSFHSNLKFDLSNQSFYPYSIFPNQSGVNLGFQWYNQLYYYVSPRSWISCDLEFGFNHRKTIYDNIIEPFDEDKYNRFLYDFGISFGHRIY